MTNPNAFANYPLDRAAHHRRDAAWIRSALESEAARVVIFHRLQPFLLEEGRARSVGWMGAHARTALAGAGPVLFLGLDADQAPHFAVEAPDDMNPAEFPLADMGGFFDLRAASASIPAGDLAVLGCAKWLFDWHKRHGFCAACGAGTAMLEAGWKRVCPACKTEHFPRVDPVVIMAPIKGDKVCLGRGPNFPKSMFSALAGFIEPGECIEDSVAREVLEEVGLKVTSVRFHSTQPWPFPSSLMIGALCEVEDETINIDPEEIAEARWFTRAEVRLMLDGKFDGAWAPPPMAIAHQILKAWVEEV